ncbi:U1 small nuclear ribonucleoprotein [Cladobotryum mycophilum]|uniref:U1 small nuclear ribonucleoprotein n=1 Tax=Cladobotryum mycophilum TaxID=491253 RepID=A0ABR0SDV7_9HYPO
MIRPTPEFAGALRGATPLRWVEHADHAPDKRKTAPIGGLAAFLPELQKYKETDEYNPTESWLERRDRKKRETKEAVVTLTSEAPKQFKPNEDPNIRGDAFKTLIVARLSYDADERDLEREFGRFGPIERIRIIVDTHAHEKPNKKKKPHRGYAFVVFEREKDMRGKLTHSQLLDDPIAPWLYPAEIVADVALRLAHLPQKCYEISRALKLAPALDACDGIRIKDRRIKVDVERGRTAKSWLPRRLGGGLGGRGYTRAMPSRPGGPGGPGGFGNAATAGGPGGGGFRGGYKGFEGGGRGRGGFRGGFGGRGGGFRGGSDFGPRGGDRGGDRNGFGAPNGAPSGPGFDKRNGGDRGFSSGGYEGRGGGRSFEDRSGGYREGGGGDRGDRGGGDRGGGDRGGGDRGGGRYGDRDRGDRDSERRDRDHNNRRTGSNMEPIGRREGGYRDRDYDRPRDDDSRKRGYEGAGYEDPRKLRRY